MKNSGNVKEIGPNISVMRYLQRLRRQHAQAMVEYAFLAVLVVLAVIFLLITNGKTINNVYSNIVVGMGYATSAA